MREIYFWYIVSKTGSFKVAASTTFYLNGNIETPPQRKQ